MAEVRRVAVLLSTDRQYHRGVLQGVARFSRLHGSWDLESEPTHAAGQMPMSRLRHLHGVMLMVTSQRQIQLLRRWNLPAVNMSSRFPEADMAHVSNDGASIARMAIEHFIERGFGNFAFDSRKIQRKADREVALSERAQGLEKQLLFQLRPSRFNLWHMVPHPHSPDLGGRLPYARIGPALFLRVMETRRRRATCLLRRSSPAGKLFVISAAPRVSIGPPPSGFGSGLPLRRVRGSKPEAGQ